MDIMRHCKHPAAGLFAILFYLTATVAQADFDDGLIAYTRLYEYKRAYREFQAEALHGHREAQFYLGEICEGGFGRSIDYKEAFRWYLDSAQRGYGPAQQRLASLYYSGRGVEKNLRNAFEWQKKAAKQGQVVAQYRLGRYYAQGIGTSANPVLAYLWWTIAASGGDPDAMRDREKLAKTLSASQIANARAMASQRETDSHASTAGRQGKHKKTAAMK
jgi:TPR repeat protein